MPVEFLSQDQHRRYGRYADHPSPRQLARYFHLDDRDRQVIVRHRGDHNRLGFAVQLGTVRFLGTFLPDPAAVPAHVASHAAHQLDIQDPTCFARYDRPQTHWDHTAEIKQTYGYRDFHDPNEMFRLLRWLYTRAWLSAERPSVLFDHATARLVEHKVLLPGVTVARWEPFRPCLTSSTYPMPQEATHTRMSRHKLRQTPPSSLHNLVNLTLEI